MLAAASVDFGISEPDCDRTGSDTRRVERDKGITSGLRQASEAGITRPASVENPTTDEDGDSWKTVARSDCSSLISSPGYNARVFSTPR